MATAQSITSKPSGFPNNTPRADTTAGATLLPTGDKLYSPDPLAPDCGVHLCSDGMAPAYRKGDTLLVRTLREGEQVTAGADYLFAQRDHTIAGNTPVLLGHLARITKTLWVCEQHNAKGHRLSRPEWPTVYVVIGLYRTSNAALASEKMKARL
jgi:hypothetical protein